MIKETCLKFTDLTQVYEINNFYETEVLHNRIDGLNCWILITINELGINITDNAYQ